jgi:hypothetical protein
LDPGVANTASLSAVPRATGIRRHLVSVLVVSLSTLTIFATTAYLIGLYLPFRLYESANGECHFLACAGTDTGAWWGFFANEDAFNHGVPFVTSPAVYVSFFALVFIGPALCLLLPVGVLGLLRDGARRRLRAIVSQAYRFEIILSAVAGLMVMVTVLAFFTPTSQRLWEVILD